MCYSFISSLCAALAPQRSRASVHTQFLHREVTRTKESFERLRTQKTYYYYYYWYAEIRTDDEHNEICFSPALLIPRLHRRVNFSKHLVLMLNIWKLCRTTTASYEAGEKKRKIGVALHIHNILAVLPASLRNV